MQKSAYLKEPPNNKHMSKDTTIEVYFHDHKCDSPLLMGILHCSMGRGKDVFFYENNKDWLKSRHARDLDPDLQQFIGKQYLPADKSQFGIFLDSSPDRWGKTLMQRREAINAKEEGRAIHKLTETDYLLGVYDANRMGALRFKHQGGEEFLDNQAQLAAPPWTQLRELEKAAWMLESHEAEENNKYRQWLKQLMAPGSSLGGARPKASVTDEQGSLWIAKFPSRQDCVNRGAWEALAYELACRCGINMAPSKAQRFGQTHHSFLSKRFDRCCNGKRIHFSSAMTQLGYGDGQSRDGHISYLEIAEWLQSHSHQPAQDLQQLWQRIVFSIAISNCDDHLRNHGFILTPKGWELSPAYDINPSEESHGLTLNISEDDNSLDFDLAQSVSEYFGIEASRAKEIIMHTQKITAQWRDMATSLNIPRSEQELMSTAFLCR